MILPKIGEKKTSVIKYSTDKVVNFAKLSGDENPRHLNEDFAKKNRFSVIELFMVFWWHRK